MREYEEFLHHNELQLAMDMLEAAVEEQAAPRGFGGIWSALPAI